MDNEVQFLIYSTAQEDVKIDVVVKDETIWLTHGGIVRRRIKYDYLSFTGNIQIR